MIRSRSNGPYGKRCLLGWGFVGLVNSARLQDPFHCNSTGIIHVNDVSTNEVANHCFIAKNAVQDASISTMLKEMYESEFNESASERRALSIEDKKILRIMEERGRKVEGHYEMPLPFRHDDTNLPNNPLQAVRRLASVKNKLLKDDKFREEYVKCIESMISKGYARKVDNRKGGTGKVW